jgi:hypothetical protein
MKGGPVDKPKKRQQRRLTAKMVQESLDALRDPASGEKHRPRLVEAKKALDLGAVLS